MRTVIFAWAGLACLMSLSPARAQENVLQLKPNPLARKGTVEGYRQHLERLQGVLAACDSQRTTAACDPQEVGPDDEVETSKGARLVHYDWLRNLLKDAAGKVESDAAKGALAERFSSAGRRLKEPVSEPAASTGEVGPVRRSLESVLAQGEFRHEKETPSWLQRAQERITQWLAAQLTRVFTFGGSNPWIAQMLEIAGIAVPCVLLLWWLMVRLRRQGLAIAPQAPAPEFAPSAKEWQRWLQDAEGYAREGNWREAVHHVYWAAISRLESRGLWPADRARTPREYLALLSSAHELRTDLRGLTGLFERIWYGNRPAAEQQYQEARAQMERLVAR